MSTAANPIDRKPGGLRLPRSVLFLCSPTLLGLILFAFAFPLRRHVPVSTNWTYSDIFFIWCVLIAPLSTVGAIALFFFKQYRHRQSSLGKILGVIILVGNAIVNNYIEYVMWVAVYFPRFACCRWDLMCSRLGDRFSQRLAKHTPQENADQMPLIRSAAFMVVG